MALMHWISQTRTKYSQASWQTSTFGDSDSRQGRHCWDSIGTMGCGCLLWWRCGSVSTGSSRNPPFTYHCDAERPFQGHLGSIFIHGAFPFWSWCKFHVCTSKHLMVQMPNDVCFRVFCFCFLSFTFFGPTFNWSHLPKLRCLVWWRCATVVSWKTPTASMHPSSDWAQQSQKWWIHNSVCCWKSSINPSMPLGSLTSTDWGDGNLLFWGLGIRCLFGMHVTGRSCFELVFLSWMGAGKSEPETKKRFWHQDNDGLLTGKWCPARMSSSVP